MSCGKISVGQNTSEITRGVEIMIDVNLIRQNPQAIRERYLKRGKDIDFTDFLKWDEERKQIIAQVETMKAQRNKVSAEVPKLKKAGMDVSATIAEMKTLGEEIARVDVTLDEVNGKIRDFLLRLPNLPDEDLAANMTDDELARIGTVLDDYGGCGKGN